MLFVDRRPLDRVVERLGVVAPPALPLLDLHHAMETSSRCGKGTAEGMAERRGGKQKRGRGGGEMGKGRGGEGDIMCQRRGEGGQTFGVYFARDPDEAQKPLMHDRVAVASFCTLCTHLRSGQQAVEFRSLDL